MKSKIMSICRLQRAPASRIVRRRHTTTTDFETIRTDLKTTTATTGSEEQKRRYIKSPHKTGACPFATSSGGLEVAVEGPRPMEQLPGPVGWPLIGNFLTYLRWKNIGKMHLVQVREK